ncbi:hypothetical protein Gohar_017855, partial [Gossypium harknessii]|nr:hypothetical protein [Gossypium harknessii]
QLEELQDKYVAQVRQCSDLSGKLEKTEKNLNETSKLLANSEEELKKCRYVLKEKEFIISQQKQAENALAHQACALRSDLEKAVKDNALLFLKIGREDKLNADNRVVVNNYQVELAQQIGSICNLVSSLMSQQNEHHESVEKLCRSFTDTHQKAILDMKKKVTAARTLHVSQMEAVQNIVRLHKGSSNAALDEISTLAASNAHSIEEFLKSEAGKAASIFNDLQGTLATHQGEMALFARELRQRFHASIEQTKNISDYTNGILDKLSEESVKVQNHAVQADEVQMKSIASFQKVYEEQSKSDSEKLIADMTNLVYNHVRRQKELVDARLVDIRESAMANKTFLDGHVSSMVGITTDAKRKWQEFVMQAENDAKDSSDYSAAKHCRMEALLQQCVSTAESAFKHSKDAQESVNEMAHKHVSNMASLIRNASDANEQHDAEIDCARISAEQDSLKSTDDTLKYIDSMSEQEHGIKSRILDSVKAHGKTLKIFHDDHSSQATSIKQRAEETFQQTYMDYEPSGTTPIRSEQDVPTKGTIESLRAMPMEALVEEFRENNSYESFEPKLLKSSVGLDLEAVGNSIRESLTYSSLPRTMLKLTKTQTFLTANHERFRLLPLSQLAATADTQETSLKSQTHTQKPLEPHPSLHIDPKYFVSVLLNCKNIFQIKQAHAQIVANGLLTNLFVSNKLLYIYVQHKAIDEAHAFFGGMREKDPVSWSVMVGGFAKDGDFVNCFRTFKELTRCSVQPDNYTLPFVLRVCRDRMDLLMGSLVHGVVLKSGLSWDHFVCAALVDMYAKCRVIDDARKLFDDMHKKDLVTWTVMIDGYAECGNANESLVLFDWMREEGIVPDKITMVTVVNACSKLGAMHKARFVHDYICSMKFSLNVILGTAMIDMYAKCGSVDFAREIFDGMREKNVISWSVMIAAYGYHGQGKKALDLFPMMLNCGIMPNRITFVSLLYACSHAGLVDEGFELFNIMWDKYGVKPDVKHCTCMVDLLGRAGRLDEALKLIENMTVEKDEGLWSAFLAACRIHKHVELAEWAAKSLLELQPQNPGHYVLLSNIYANAGMWEDMAKVRNLMTKRNLKKIPGWTWIEVDNKIHQFSVGDKSHPLSKEIYGLLKSLIEKLELAGYVPDTNFVLHDVDEEVKVGMLYTHSEKLAITFGLIATPEGTPIRITKNLRVCGDCHTFIKFVSAITKRSIIVRDSNRFHHFIEGACSCGDYW